MNTKTQLMAGVAAPVFAGFGPRTMMSGPMVTHAPDEQGGGGNGGDNQQGNSSDGGNTDESQNNSGSGFDPAAFWSEPEAASIGSPGNQGSAESKPAASGDDKKTEGATFAERLSQITFGDLFNEDIAKQLNDGDFAGANKAFQSQLQHAAVESVKLTADLMLRNNESIIAKVTALIDEKLGTEKNQDQLLKHFPGAAKDPAMATMIRGIFSQALKHTKNDRDAAVTMTRDMMKYAGTTHGKEFGIPENRSDGLDGDNAENSKRLVEELLGRS